MRVRVSQGELAQIAEFGMQVLLACQVIGDAKIPLIFDARGIEAQLSAA